MKNFLLTFCVAFLFLNGNAQRKQGTWQDYLSFSEAIKVAVSPTKTFCATNGGLFYYDQEDKSVVNASEVVKLSDFGPKTIAWNNDFNVLVLAYTNSSIDLIYGSKVVNLSDIKRKQLSGDKVINNISFIGKEAFLACGFGIVVIDLEKNEIKDTYLIGDDGSMLGVNDVETDGTSIFAATDRGVLKAPLTGADLRDYNSWKRILEIPFNTSKFSFLAFHGGNIIANYTPEQYSGDRMYRFDGSNWIDYLSQIQYLNDLQVNGNYLVATSRERVYIINNSHAVVKEVGEYNFGNVKISPVDTKSAALASDGVLYMADYKNALIKATGETFEMIYPMGPIDNQMFTLKSENNDLWIAAGGRTSSWNNMFQLPRFQLYKQGQWKYYNKNNNAELTEFFDIVDIAPDPKNPEHFYVASWGGGVLEYNGEEFVQRFNNKNSPLETPVPTNPDAAYTRIGGIDFDSQGNLWITNSEVAHNLHSLSPDGKWTSFTLPEVANSLNIGQVLVNRNDDKWIVVPRGHDAYVVNKAGDKKKRLLVTSYFNNGQNEIFNRMNDIYSIAEDNEGAIWLGTSKGVAVYTSPGRIWESTTFYAMQPSLELNDGLYHPLLESETVTAIAVDGANRKWLGTMNSGVYLVSENGTEELLHFTAENSPLFSNTITSIALNQKSGEVFIGTDKGLISYMGEATSGADTYDSVYVYPNPVRETYDGPVTIANLVENSEVKITDIAGNLVFRTTSLGGQAVWDGRNLNGNRVKTGVYLVMCNDENGELTHISKLLFIH